MVSVLPTAQSIPPSSAHTIRCGLSRRSAKRNRVPLMTVGSDQRATNAPITMPIEMRNGGKAGDKFCRRFSAAQPHCSRKPAEYPEPVQ